MKFTVLKDNLAKGLSVVSKAINVRTPLPVLSNILVKTEQGRLKLVASDLQVTISSYIGVKIDNEGETTVPAKVLMEFVNQISDEKITAVLTNGTLKIQTKTVDAKFSCMPASEFPEFDDSSEGDEFVFSSEMLSKAVQKVKFVVAVDESRPILTGVYIKIVDGFLFLVGTDGYRMAEYKINIENSGKSSDEKKNITCILPAKAFAEVIKAFAATSDKIKIIINNKNNTVVVKGDDVEARIRMIEGEYPGYEALLPDDFVTEIRMSKEEFSNGIKLANVFSRDMGNAVKIIMSDDGIRIESQPSEAGSNVTTLKGEFEGEDVEIGFNAKYLLDFVNNTEEEEIIFKANESLKPVVFSTMTKENYFSDVPDKKASYFYLVMPMKAAW